LHLYWMMPFQAVGGLNVFTTRLPFAVAGVITIGLICYVGNRVFGPPVGLVAAGFMALNPWHIQQSRWGHEVSLCPLLVSGCLALMIWARLPIFDTDEPPRPWRSVLAGAALGLSMYGYQAMRAFLPGFIVLLILLTFPAWWRQAKTRTGLASILGFVVAGLVVFGPLAYKHIAEPQRIGRQMTETVWKPGDPLHAKILAALSRYPGHFGPEFLFIDGDPLPFVPYQGSLMIEKPPLAGQFAWYTLPLFVYGAFYLILRLRVSRAARVLLTALAAYPLSDCLVASANMHPLRSLPGLPGLILLAALGGVALFQSLYRLRITVAWGFAAVMALAAIGLSGHHAWQMLVDYPRRPLIYHYFQTDLLEACQWLRPRLKDVDYVLCTSASLNQPYSVSLVGLDYDPAQWFRDEQDVDTSGRWDVHKRFGKMHFLYDPGVEKDFNEYMKQSGKRALLILRPGSGLKMKPVHQILRPDGGVTLEIYELRT
jgi:4-amino-4-deoxy-L-arabinose transferase-like glycosyltransferase